MHEESKRGYQLILLTEPSSHPLETAANVHVECPTNVETRRGRKLTGDSYLSLPTLVHLLLHVKFLKLFERVAAIVHDKQAFVPPKESRGQMNRECGRMAINPDAALRRFCSPVCCVQNKHLSICYPVACVQVEDEALIPSMLVFTFLPHCVSTVFFLMYVYPSCPVERL